VTIKGFTIREWIEKMAPMLLMGLIVWGIGLYAWQKETTRRMDEQERQNLKQWESIDRIKSESEMKELLEWKRLVEPMILKGAGL